MAIQLKHLRSMLNENMEDQTREMVSNGVALLERFETYTTKTEFHVGDFVHWKPGMSCRSVPKSDEVGIVTEVFPQPVFDPLRKSAGEPTFREPLTIRIGLLLGPVFQEFFMDGGRMQVVRYESLSGSQRTCADKLRDFVTRLQDPRSGPLQPGDIVRWKAGLKVAKRPDYDQHCVVMETFPTYYSDKRGACASGFRDPADVRIGIPDSDGDVMIYMFDSRRFEKVPESEL